MGGPEFPAGGDLRRRRLLLTKLGALPVVAPTSPGTHMPFKVSTHPDGHKRWWLVGAHEIPATDTDIRDATDAESTLMSGILAADASSSPNYEAMDRLADELHSLWNEPAGTAG
jgi:hypothetical protein